MKKKDPVYLTALALLVVGGLNWGLVGLADYNAVDSLLGAGSMLAKVVYLLVGVSAVYLGGLQVMKTK